MGKEMIIDDITDEELDEYYLGEDYSNDELAHEGKGHLDGGHSGRYPWGSGEKEWLTARNYYERVGMMRKKGLTNSEIAAAGGFKTISEMQMYYTLSKDEWRMEKLARVHLLKDKGYGATEIGRMMADEFNNGVPIRENTIRGYLIEEAEKNTTLALKTSKELQALVDKHGFIDIGKGSNLSLNNGLGVSNDKMNKAVKILESKGYVVKKIKVEQVTNVGNHTTMIVLAKPGTVYREFYEAKKNNNIHSIEEYKENITRDDGKPNRFIYPKAMNPKRLKVISAEEGGSEKDGLVEIRPGVKDLSLGGSNYAQVRILVDGGGGDKDYYIKGMAVYGNPKDFPPGVDVIFNSNKSQEKIKEKGVLDAALKSVKDNLTKDETNPFGSAIKEVGGQSFYDDPKGEFVDAITGKKQSLSLINKRSDEGDWAEWSKKLPSQFLSKQPMELINRQLDLAYDDKLQEFNEIMSLDNDVIKKQLLLEFARGTDRAAVDLQAAALPGQTYKVIMPIPSLADKEIYCPTLDNGTKVALIRYPHGGLFEIPILKVNNLNKEGQHYLTSAPKDAVGINIKTAQQLSGADFDGDTVQVIPLSNRIKVAAKQPLEELKDFSPDEYASDKPITKDADGKLYGEYRGHKFKLMEEGHNKQLEMGKISNLITDMTLKGSASDEELARAVKHSMVVIDAVKHKLDYKASEKANGIDELKQKYQLRENGKYGGASTLISKASAEIEVPKREAKAWFTKDTHIRVECINPEVEEPSERKFKDSDGNIYDSKQVKKEDFDPLTGQKVFTPKNDYYYKAKVTINGKKQNVDVRLGKDGNFTYKDKETGEFIVVDPSIVKQHERTEKSTRMFETEDANTLVSVYKTQQELAYAKYANKLKALANEARKSSYFLEGFDEDKEAKKKYKEERDSLEYKKNQAMRNKPKERQAQLIANSRVAAIIAENPGMDNDHKNKTRQRELYKARQLVGAARNPVNITEKEWEAIQARAISKTTLKELINCMDSDVLKSLAMPRETKGVSVYKINHMNAMASAGYTISEIARYYNLSPSTVSKYLKKGE